MESTTYGVICLGLAALILLLLRVSVLLNRIVKVLENIDYALDNLKDVVLNFEQSIWQMWRK